MPDLLAEAQRLSDPVEGRLHARTKADIGYALAGRPQALVAGTEAPPHAGHDRREIRSSTSCCNSFAHLTANDDCARLNLHVEGVHQCRIALRRLRSAFKIYRPLLRRKRIEPIDEEVRWLGNVLGTARDLDVLQAELLEPASEALGEAEQLAPLMVSLEAQKADAYGHVGEALASARYRHFLIDLCALGARRRSRQIR